MTAMSVGSATGRPKTFSADVTASSTARGGFEAFRQAWESQTGKPWPLAGLDIAASTDFRIGVQSVQAHDVMIADFYSDSYMGRTTADRAADDKVLIHVMRRGTWRFDRYERGGAVAVPAGAFIVRHDGPPTLFQVSRGATAQILTMPASVLGPLIGDRQLVGPADAPELRLLTAHASLLAETVHDLSPAGERSARDALLHLAEGVVRREFDDTEPRLAPALARAAMRIADDRLADPDLSPTVLARELNVSLRTLHRAFTATDDTLSAYIRRRRLERARLDLAAPLGRLEISEVAARWQFADSSHFIRAFRQQYGQTPARFARQEGGLNPSNLPNHGSEGESDRH